MNTNTTTQLKGAIKLFSLLSLVLLIYIIYTAFKLNKCTSETEREKYKQALWWLSANAVSIFIFLMIKQFSADPNKARLWLGLCILGASVMATLTALMNKDYTGTIPGCDSETFKKSDKTWIYTSISVNTLLFILGGYLTFKKSPASEAGAAY